MVSSSKKLSIIIIWFMTWPIGMYTLYTNSSFTYSGYELDIISFIVLASIIALFPLLIGDHPVFFTHGISFAVFLYFGLFVEVLVTQIALIILMIKVRVGLAGLYRVPLNQLLFFVVSVCSALIYYILGGDHGREALNSFSDIIPILAYPIVQIIINQLLISSVSRHVHGKETKWFDQGVIWELLTTMLVAPVGLMLYILYAQIGAAAIYVIGLPFIFISIMLLLYHNSKRVNEYLQKTGDIGHELTGNYSVKEILDIFIDRVSSMLPLDYIYVFDVVPGRCIKLIRFYDRSGRMNFPNIELGPGESISGDTWAMEKGRHYHAKKDWKHLQSEYTPEGGESVLSIPISRNSEIVSIITLYSNKKRAFMKYQYMILTILGSYLTVAIENARHHEKAKSENERCPLTGLYNYRFFEKYVAEMSNQFAEAQIKEPASMILLDIDHFKSVNDTYGHESGNEILCQLGERLINAVSSQGIVARYGGEEFVILLPQCSTERALRLAEKIRQAISGESFLSYAHMLSGQTPKKIHITASIGVATYPDHCEELIEITRLADRAMYVGAKQSGRNRVAGYENMRQTVE
ncbi:sensor domain-containing diguanylate cyclase [Halobacillus hunanensis]|uniref:sensor domain-containing diguanylate cyclase n=1 Tax=Halobacillus hunanensis TaxID=578214 RepID=UPI0009A7B0C8|nr:diguanylate cyclase [Halobacillus hunanensis]